MVPVIANEPVAYWSLRRSSLDRRVGLDDAHRCVKARIGNAPHANPTIVIGYVFEQPLDRIMGVAAFVDFARLLVWNERAVVDKLPLRHPPAAHVLVDKDVALARHCLRWADSPFISIRAIGRDAVWRPAEHNRVLLRGVLRGINYGKQL